MRSRFVVQFLDRSHVVEICEEGDGYEVAIDGVVHQVDSARLDGSHVRSLLIGGRSWETHTVEDGDRFDVYLSGEVYPVQVIDEVWARARQGHVAKVAHGEVIQAPIPGSVVRILVQVGDTVAAGTPVAVLEAMKMQNELTARNGGIVATVHVAEGDTVAQGHTLITLKPADS